MKIKHINLFGCGKTALQFYQTYQTQVEIGYLISNNKKETIFAPENGVEYQVRRPAAKERQEDLVVICSNDYDAIADQLMLLGYEPFEDFIDYQLAELLLSGKKLALLYGVCHLRGISECLRRSQAFTKDYAVFYYANYLSYSTYRSLRFHYVLDHCELLIYGYAVSPESYRNNEAVLGRVQKGIQTLCLPIICFGGYFPQSRRAFNAMNEYAVKSEGYDYTPFSYGDSWLNACIDKGMRLEDIMEALETSNVYECDFVLQYLEEEWKRLRFQEKQGDFQFVDYIQEHFQSRRLFRNEAHMENELLLHYSRGVLRRLGMKEDITECYEPLMKCSQHVIYPSTARALGLKWDVLGEKLDLYTYGGWRKVSVRDYIAAYRLSGSAIRQLKHEKLLP